MQGAFLANPPFETALLHKAARRMGELLAAADTAGGRLTFVVVLPRRPEEARAALDTRRCSPMHVLNAATSCARQAAPPRIRRAGARCTVQRT